MIEEIKKYAENLNEVYALEQEMGQYQYLIDIGNKAPSFTKEEQNELKSYGTEVSLCQYSVYCRLKANPHLIKKRKER